MFAKYALRFNNNVVEIKKMGKKIKFIKNVQLY